MKTRLFSLLLKHQSLDEAVRAEQARRTPDPFRLLRLKRLKLAVKDRLYRLSVGRPLPRLA